MNRKRLLRDAFSGVKIKEALVRICHNDGGIIMVVNSRTQLYNRITYTQIECKLVDT